MRKKEEKRIYVVIPAIVETRTGYVRQPKGRQIAQACHVVSKLRHQMFTTSGPRAKMFLPITTIILTARNSRNIGSAYLTMRNKNLRPVFFSDENQEAYGDFHPITAMAVYATKKQLGEALDAFPLWGS